MFPIAQVFASLFSALYSPVLAATEMNQRIWYSLPLLVSVSLVYAATRHEEVGPLLNHAWRFALGIVLFMGVIAAVIQITTWTL